MYVLGMNALLTYIVTCAYNYMTLVGSCDFVLLQHSLVPTRLFSSDIHGSTVAKQRSSTSLPSPGNSPHPSEGPATRTHQQHTVSSYPRSPSPHSSSSATNTAAITRAAHVHCPTTSPIKHPQSGSSAGQHNLLLSHPKRDPLLQSPGRGHPDETSTTQPPTTTTTTCATLLEAMEHCARGVLGVVGRVLRVYRRTICSGSHTQ